MSVTPQALRNHFAISQLCQVFEAVLQFSLEEGFPRHQLHYLASPIVLEEGGRRIVLPDPQLGCIYEVSRLGPLNIPEEDRILFARRPPFESLLLAMTISDGTKLITQRTRFLQESERLFLDLAERGDHIFVVGVSHRRLIHGRIVVRHQPAALFDLLGKRLWLHPAGPRFGLIKANFSRSQKHRLLDPAGPRLRDRSEFLELDQNGMPTWVEEARQALREEGEEDPVTDAFLESQGRSMLQVSIEEEAMERMQIIAQDFLADFERFFGMGGLLPVPGILDQA